MRHQHGGKLFQLIQDGTDTFAGVEYRRWTCTNCKAVTLEPVGEPNGDRLPLDPKPWLCSLCSDRFPTLAYFNGKPRSTHDPIFHPRSEYEQDKAFYA